jgi:hypothetical protein
VKLTNPETIQESEKEFIDAINAELDWDSIEKLLLEKHKFAIQDEVDYKEGNLIVHDNQIAYKFDFEIKVPLSVIFNRQGECVEISTTRDDVESQDGDFLEEDDIIDDNEIIEEDEMTELPVKPMAGDKVGQMASDIADMISEINQGDE